MDKWGHRGRGGGGGEKVGGVREKERYVREKGDGGREGDGRKSEGGRETGGGRRKAEDRRRETDEGRMGGA